MITRLGLDVSSRGFAGLGGTFASTYRVFLTS